ncbi:MAG: DNA alkylation repair protein [archaeon]
MQISSLRMELLSYKNSAKAKILQGFFKTRKGEYGEGDIFYGITVPQTRSIAKSFQEIEIPELNELIKSKIHEERLCALLILVEKYKKSTSANEKRIIKDFYLANTKHINNWDLVDLSSHQITGEWYFTHPLERKKLFELANSNQLWEKRIAIISTYYFIKEKKFEETLKISKILLNDTHDLIHKAVGWMLREVGKRDFGVEEEFLQENYKKMPRTMLRYAIEKFPEKKRLTYLKGTA